MTNDTETRPGPLPRGSGRPASTTRLGRGSPGPRASRLRTSPAGTIQTRSPGSREERYYGKLLVWMVAALILAGFILGIVLVIATGSFPA